MVAVRYRTALFHPILIAASAILASGVTVLTGSGPASAAVPGFQVQITELPGEFASGENPKTVTVVASTDVGRACQKVRWSLVLRVNGISLNQVSVERVEDTGAFATAVQADGDTARVTDVKFDPGSLCRGQTVTARYQVSFAQDVTDGQVTFQAEAYDTTERLLQLATATREVVDRRAARSEQAQPSPSATADDPASDEPSQEAVEPTASATPGGVATVPTAAAGGDSHLLGTGVVVGAVLIFLGVGLLLRLKLRGRRSDGPQPFYPAM
jgi:hypothetical protein